MNKGIIYFTNANRLCNTLGANPKRLYPFLTVNKDIRVIGYPQDFPRILLVNDQLSLEDFKRNIWSEIGSKFLEIAFVYHNAPDQDIINFLSEKTSLRQKGSHQNNVEGYELYLPLVDIIEHQDIKNEEFESLWQQFVIKDNAETDLSDEYQKWLTSLTPAEVGVKTNVIYIDKISQDVKTIFRTYNIAAQSPSEIDPTNFTENTNLIIPCELDNNEDGQEVSRTEYYGIQLAQNLRRRYSFRGKIVFTKNRIKYPLLFIERGHAFAHLPSSLHSIVDTFNTIESLDELSLRDIQLFATNISGVFNEEIHRLENQKENYQQLHEDLLTQVFSFYNQSVQDIISDYKKINSSFTEALSFIETKCKAIIADNSETTAGSSIRPSYRWSILWLDDEVSRKYQKGETVEIIEHLKTERGIQVTIVPSYEEAEADWEKDRATTKTITVIISDYRLNSKDENGIVTQNKQQGYHFIQKIMREEQTTAVFVYSGLPRRFLMDTFSYYSRHIRFYSKKDLPLTNTDAYSFICDEIIIRGDDAWISINNQPISSEWYKNDGKNERGKPMNEVYFDFKNSLEFRAWNEQCNITTARNVSRYKKGILTDFKNTGSNFTSSPGKQLGRLKEILTARRFAITILAEEYFHIQQSNNEDSLIPKKKEIANYIHYGNSTKEPTKKTADNVFSRLALNVSNFPLFLLAEEYAWLKYESNKKFEDHIDIYFYALRRIKECFGKTFSQFKDGFLHSLLDKKRIYLIRKEQAINTKLRDGFGKDERIKSIYFDDNYHPVIRTSWEVKIILSHIYFHLNPSNTLTYQQQLLELSTLLSEIDIIIHNQGDNCPRSFKTLLQFIKVQLPAKTSNDLKKQRKGEDVKRAETIIEEYNRLYQPWIDFLPTHNAQLRIENFKKACTNLSKVTSSSRIFINTNEWYKKFISSGMPLEEATNKAIYTSIFYWKEDRNEKFRQQKEKSRDSFISSVGDNKPTLSDLSTPIKSGESELYNYDIDSYDEDMDDETFERLRLLFLNKMEKLKLLPSKRTEVYLCNTYDLPKPIESIYNPLLGESAQFIAVFTFPLSKEQKVNIEQIKASNDKNNPFILIPLY